VAVPAGGGLVPPGSAAGSARACRSWPAGQSRDEATIARGAAGDLAYDEAPSFVTGRRRTWTHGSPTRTSPARAVVCRDKNRQVAVDLRTEPHVAYASVRLKRDAPIASHEPAGCRCRLAW